MGYIRPSIKKQDCIDTYIYLKSMSEECDFVVLDTETTGLDENAEIIELAVIDKNGHILLNTLIKPSQPMPLDCEAVNIHGITNEMLFNPDVPTWEQVYPKFEKIIKNKVIFIYNSDFDKRLIAQTQKKIDNKFLAAKDPIPNKTICLMKEFANWYGEESYKRPGTYQWKKLSQAARIIGYSGLGSHRALSDCKTALAVLRMILLAKNPKNIDKARKQRALLFVQYLIKNNAIILNINHFLEIRHGNKSNIDVLDICIMDMNGNVLLNEQISPLSKYKKDDFLEPTGWTLEYLKTCPNWEVIYPKIYKLLHGKSVITHSLDDYELLAINNYTTRFKKNYPRLLFKSINFRSVCGAWLCSINSLDYEEIATSLKIRRKKQKKTALAGCQLVLDCLLKISKNQIKPF